jgi:hypothetical protein
MDGAEESFCFQETLQALERERDQRVKAEAECSHMRIELGTVSARLEEHVRLLNEEMQCRRELQV